MNWRLPSQPKTAARAAFAVVICLGALTALRQDGSGNSKAGPAQELASSQLQTLSRRNELCSSANVVGVGLRGEYFAETGLRGGVLLTRIDSSIDFGASLAWPADESRPAPKSIRWTGWVKSPMTGRYRFHFDLPDARVQVARQTVAGAGAPREAFLDLVAGRFYPISIELSAIDGARVPPIRLEWTAPHGARYVVPRALLNLPTDTARNV